MAATVLSVEGLTATIGLGRGATAILDNVSFRIDQGEVLGIVGESGSGKSMLAIATIGLLPPPIHRRSGRNGLLAEDLTAMSPQAWTPATAGAGTTCGRRVRTRWP